jgi:cytoskeletal protein CcmA (bactofilin family)
LLIGELQKKSKSQEMKTEKYSEDYVSANYFKNSDTMTSGRGDLNFTGNLSVTGVFSGKLNVSGRLTISKEARVSGEITTNDLIVEGQLQGSARVSGKAVFFSESFFSGALSAGEAEFHHGCFISGKRVVGRVIELDRLSGPSVKSINAGIPVSIPDEITHKK